MTPCAAPHPISPLSQTIVSYCWLAMGHLRGISELHFSFSLQIIWGGGVGKNYSINNEFYNSWQLFPCLVSLPRWTYVIDVSQRELWNCFNSPLLNHISRYFFFFIQVFWLMSYTACYTWNWLRQIDFSLCLPHVQHHVKHFTWSYKDPTANLRQKYFFFPYFIDDRTSG